MLAISSVALFVALRFLLLLVAPTSPARAVPLDEPKSTAPSSYWLSNIKRQGKVAYGDSNFQIFRNVKDFGAKGTFCSPTPPLDLEVTDNFLQVTETPTTLMPLTRPSPQATDAVRDATRPQSLQLSSISHPVHTW